MIARPLSELKAQAEGLMAKVTGKLSWAELEVEESVSMVGGGSLPGEELGSYALTISPKECSCELVMEQLRAYEIPIIAHIKEEKVWLDMRTVMPEDVSFISQCLLTLPIENLKI